MRTPFAVSLLCIGLVGTGQAAPASTTTSSLAATKALDESRLAEAQMLKDEHRYLEAAAVFAELSKTQPDNGNLVARQADMLAMQAKSETDSVKARSLNKQARALAEKAEQLGTTDPIPPLILASIKPDGSTEPISPGAFSKREEVDKWIRDGEDAFTKHDYKKAGECYQKAYELEPANYQAALWAGDANFADRALAAACDWYRKAILISPDAETAHRYLGDALGKLGRHDDALAEWVAALLCEPYLRTTRQHFTADMRAAAEARGHVIPRFPAMRSTIEGKEIKLAVNPDDGPLIMGYNLCAMGWRSKEFAEHFPGDKTPRRSLPEEIAAIEGMLDVATGTKEPDKAGLKKWQSVIDGLLVLKREGLLEAYVFFERPDKELAKDYAAYRTEHRDKLERYIRVYWCGLD